MNPKKVTAKLVKGIKQFFLNANKKKAVLGLSGGLDSAVCAFLLARAIGPKNVTALLLPQKGISSQKSVLEAKKLAKQLEINYFVVQLNPFIAPFSKVPWKQSKRATTTTTTAGGASAGAAAAQNIPPRQRVILLYHFANSKNAVVCGTSNKSELLLGYFTKFGDGAADFLPLGGLYKTQVRELAIYNQLSASFIEKPPSAELEPGQTDEKDIGAKYEEIDAILKLAVEKKKTKNQVIAKSHSERVVTRIFSLVKQNKHKREMPPIMGI